MDRCIVAGANIVRQRSAHGRKASRTLSTVSSVRGMLTINYIIMLRLNVVALYVAVKLIRVIAYSGFASQLIVVGLFQSCIGINY